MKIPYKTEIINLTLMLLFLLICLANYEMLTTPDPTIYPVTPSFLWEFGYALTLVTTNYPTAVPIWTVSILYLVQLWRAPEIKPETKKEVIARLREVNATLSRELSYANSRLDEKVKKLVYLEALVGSRRCPNCLEVHEE
jgi:hypothetical protein